MAYLEALGDEDNGSGVIAETDFDRWLDFIFGSLEYDILRDSEG